MGCGNASRLNRAVAGCDDAVFGSWNNARAIKYRELYKITNLRGTAVNIQSMVFGNLGETSGTGVAFSRNPSTGENKYYGEYLMNAQGEDVVAGIRQTLPLSTLKQMMPAVYEEFAQTARRLRHLVPDLQALQHHLVVGIGFALLGFFVPAKRRDIDLNGHG